MFFKNLFTRPKKETPEEMLRRLKPELFDTSGKTYNGGIFSDSSDAYSFTEFDIELFPELIATFLNVTDFEESFLLPLCAFDLRIINKTWIGKAHFIHFYKSQSDTINADSLINQYGDYNVSLFNIQGDKISYTGDKDAFQLSAVELEYWTKTKNNYLINAKKQRVNTAVFLNDRKIKITQIIRQVGSTPMWIQSNETPNPVDNEEIFFVGQLNVNSLISEGEWIYLFFSPQKKLLIQVEQWT